MHLLLFFLDQKLFYMIVFKDPEIKARLRAEWTGRIGIATIGEMRGPNLQRDG